jgi:predicted methyltransferase
MVNPDLNLKVIDADSEVLENIKKMALKFRLKIEAEEIDIRKKRHLNEKFIGFLTNPIYTVKGVKEFMNFGKNQLGEDGGFCFLELGDESIGNRFLDLQEFFAKNQLRIREVITNRIYYPYIELYEEDKEILRRMTQLVDEKTYKNSPRIGASLYIFEYFPQRPKKLKIKIPIYAYL